MAAGLRLAPLALALIACLQLPAAATPNSGEALRVLKDPHAWGAEKLEAMYAFLDSASFSEEAFWALLDTAGFRSHPEADKLLRPEDAAYPPTFRSSALFFLSTALAYSSPDDFAKGRLLLGLVQTPRFKKAMADLETDRSSHVRQQRLYLLGAMTVNTRVELVRALAPTIVPMILPSLAWADHQPIVSDGVWALEQYLAAGPKLSSEIRQEIERLASTAPDPQTRERLSPLTF